MSNLLSPEVLKGILTKPKEGPKNHYIADCPFCGKEKHFFINKGRSFRGVPHGWDCKKCGKEGNIYSLLAKLGKLFLLEGRQVDIRKDLSFKPIKFVEEEDIDITIETIKLPIGFKPLNFDSEHPAAVYLRSRKFTELDFELYHPGTTKLKRIYRDYVIIPIYRDGEIKGFLSRYIGKRTDDEVLRYLNSEHDFSKLLAGYDELNENTTTVILVEGFFDKASVDTELNLHWQDEMKCVCTFGKKLSASQIFLLQKAGIQTLIFMYDGRDAVKDMKKIAGEVTEYFDIFITYTGKNDPGESDANQLLKYLSDMQKPAEFFFEKLNFAKLK